MDAVVVLNRNFEYWTEVPVKRVLKWIVQDKIEIVACDEGREIGSVTFKIKMPLVVRLLNFVGFKPKSTKVPFSQGAVFQRDNMICQYYHRDAEGNKFKYKCNSTDLTVDHVLPVSRGGKNTFDNVVACCRTCNEILKKNKTPHEAGLELIRKPAMPVRDKNSYMIMKFTFNPNKTAHQKFMEIFGVRYK